MISFIDRVVNIPVVQQWQVQQFKVVQKVVEITQMQFLGKVVDIPGVVQRQVSMVQVVQRTVGREERQSACVIATGRVAT